MEKKVYELTISETLEHVMPPLQEMELELLEQSLLADGCRDPLVAWNGILIDGHNRYRICHEHNIPFSYIEMEFENEAAARLWIIKNQLARRNVPDFVRCEMVIPLETELKAVAKKRQGQRNDLGNIQPILAGSEKAKTSRETLSELARVSHGTFDKARHLVNNADDETKYKLRNGEISINRAYNEMRRNQNAKNTDEQEGDANFGGAFFNGTVASEPCLLGTGPLPVSFRREQPTACPTRCMRFLLLRCMETCPPEI